MDYESRPLLMITDSLLFSLSPLFFPSNFIAVVLLYFLSMVMALILFLMGFGLTLLQQRNNLKHNRSQSKTIRCEISQAELMHPSS